MEYNDLLEVYFRLGLTYKEILLSLAVVHGIVTSLRTLKRDLKRLGLFRRKYKTDIFEVVGFVRKTILQEGNHHGYRWMHLQCIQSGLSVDRETIRLLLQVIDEEGVATRRRKRLQRRSYFAKGPNFIWHVDSYDKLKPYGFCINGCIDGFSRAIMWLKVYTTNSNPRIVAGYFMKEVQRRSACPKLIRGDMGTENAKIREFQNFLTRKDSFLYGTSQHNQRIERWWGILRKEFSQFWINTLRRLTEVGLYNGGFLDKNLLQFCCMRLMQVSCLLSLFFGVGQLQCTLKRVENILSVANLNMICILAAKIVIEKFIIKL